ncbi:hypothetical protein EYC84_007657 [Monilinia fructicola]|uniref:PH domain-containing protein n=1 Tax=Monilinia fructicola TaxID=38448 RepID=A0A5M9JLM1_MONFR|nr:hypothetical protein EYC84_007657 [Monilinia fructicola]
MSQITSEFFRNHNHVIMDELSIAPQIAPIASSRALSMDDYYKQQNDASDQDQDQDQEAEVEEEPEEELEQEHDPEMDVEDKPTDSQSMIDPLLDLPPSYDASDEGREELPGYSAGISLENVFLRKMELQGAIHRASDRNWYRVLATLQGTLLSFHKIKGSGVFGRERGEGKGTPDLPAGTRKGSLLASYNLLHADVGICCGLCEKALRHSSSSRSRPVPSILCQDRNLCDLASITLHSHRPLYAPRRTTNSSATSATSRPSTSRSTLRLTPSISRLTPPHTPRTPEECVPEAEAAVDALREMGLIGGRTRRPRTLQRRTPNPKPSHSFCPETGKWRPEHAWSPKYDMIYARRCMAVLTSRSPRKSNYLIMKGKEWIVDWSTGSLIRCEPPAYGEDYCGAWKIGYNGLPVKA